MPPTLEDNHYSAPYDGLAQYAAPRQNTNYSSPVIPKGSGSRTKSDALEGLRALPEVRPIPWAPGKEVPPEKSTESARQQTRGAFLMSTRGVVNNPPCTHCRTGAGRFSLCVSLDGWFQNACATCQMGTRGNHCSLRTDAAEGLLPANGSALASPAVTNTQIESSKKRKRAPANEVTTSYQDSGATMGEDNAPGDFTAPAQNVQYQTPYPANSYQPQNTVQDDRSALLQYVYQKQYPANGTKRHHILHQSGRDTPEATPESSQLVNKNNRIGVGGAPADGQGEDSKSMSPNMHMPQAAQNQNYVGTLQPSYNDTSTPLIDTLPRKKQKQIFGIIGGIQSGIRNVRQQADDLQKQLDLLQAALGIDTDGDDNV